MGDDEHARKIKIILRCVMNAKNSKKKKNLRKSVLNSQLDFIAEA